MKCSMLHYNVQLLHWHQLCDKTKIFLTEALDLNNYDNCG